MQPTKEASIEVVKILDSLTVLSADLKCADDIPEDELSALKQILQISVEAGGGPVPVVVAQRLDDADHKGSAPN